MTDAAHPAPTKSGLDLVGALKDAAIAAFVAFGLFSLVLGLRTEQGTTGALELIPRPGLLFSAVVAVTVGRFFISLLFRSGVLARHGPFISPSTQARLDYIGTFVGAG